MTSHPDQQDHLQSTTVQKTNVEMVDSNNEDDDDDDDDLSEDSTPKNFKWTMKPEKCLLFNMIRLKPSGINKHLSMLLLREKVSRDLKLNISTKCIWKYLKTKWDIDAADVIEHGSFSRSKKNFELPKEYEQLISEEAEKLKKLKEKSLNDEMNKKKSITTPGKMNSNSTSSIDSKDDLGENATSEDILSTRRSLRINENLEEIELENDKKKSLRVINKLDDPNKSKHSKLLNKKTPSQLKQSENNEKVVNVVRGQKRKSRNVSESSSDNSKLTRSYKNNLTDKTFSDSSSRSVTPEILRGKTFNRSVTPEITTTTATNRKSNLRSSDKDSKATTSQTVDKSCFKYGHKVDLILPEIKIERFKATDKSEKQVPANSLNMKSKQLTSNKNESNIKVKGKIRNRVTSDLSVALQSPEIQSLGRRSCNNKN